MKCSKCGCEFQEGDFCPECGTKYIVPINGSNSEKSGDMNNTQMKDKKQVYGLLSIIFAIIAWLGIVTVIIPIVCGVASIIFGIKAIRYQKNIELVHF